MSKREFIAFLQDILNEIHRLNNFIERKDYQYFLKDEKTQYAVIRCLEIIGEAVKNIPNSVKQRYKNIDWRRVAGLRDILIHEYFGINLTVLWDIIQNKVPELYINIQEILKKETRNP